MEFLSTVFTIFLTFVLLEQSLAITLWFGSDKVKLSDVQVVTLYAGRMTTTRRIPAVPQMKCVGGSAGCDTYVFEVVQCYNRGTDGFVVQWECKANMDATYRFGKTDLNCEGYDYPDDPYILKGSCGVEYSLDLSNGGTRYMMAYFIWGIVILLLTYGAILVFQTVSTTREFTRQVDKNTPIFPPIKSKSSVIILKSPAPAPESRIPIPAPAPESRIPILAPAPESRIPIRVSIDNDNQHREIQINNNRPVQKSLIPVLCPPDINNNTIQDVVVSDALQSNAVGTKIENVSENTVQNNTLKTGYRNSDKTEVQDIISVNTDRNSFASSNLATPLMVNNEHFPVEEVGAPLDPANCNQYIIVTNTTNTVIASFDKPYRNRSEDFEGGLLAAQIIMARSRDAGRSTPTPTSFGTRTVSGFGSTKRR